MFRRTGQPQNSPNEQVCDQPAEKSEDDEEIEKSAYSEMEVLCEAYVRDEAACKGLTSMDPCEFDDFVAKSTPALDATTYKGIQRVPLCLFKNSAGYPRKTVRFFFSV